MRYIRNAFEKIENAYKSVRDFANEKTELAVLVGVGTLIAGLSFLPLEKCTKRDPNKYDSKGRLVEEIGESGLGTRLKHSYVRDEFGRLIKNTFRFDENRGGKVDDAEIRNITEYEYDSSGRVSRRVYRDGGYVKKTCFEYLPEPPDAHRYTSPNIMSIPVKKTITISQDGKSTHEVTKVFASPHDFEDLDNEKAISVAEDLEK